MLELDTIERLGGNLDEHFEEMLNPAPGKNIVARLKALSKTYFEDVSGLFQIRWCGRWGQERSMGSFCAM